MLQDNARFDYAANRFGGWAAKCVSTTKSGEIVECKIVFEGRGQYPRPWLKRSGVMALEDPDLEPQPPRTNDSSNLW